MCRFLAYLGAPIFLDELVYTPAHSLIHQSLHATEAKTETNGDGFGLGWYGDRTEPGIYHEVLPAWSDQNLRSLCGQIRSRLFFAHVRASTGTALSRSNCHPFRHQADLFMHNGQIGGYRHLKRQIETVLPDTLYEHRLGTTDSEALFLMALANGLRDEPIAAMERTLGTVQSMLDRAGITEPLRFTSCYTNGETLWAYRWASDDKAPSLYYREEEGGYLVVSEPIDEGTKCWNVVPKQSVLRVDAGGIHIEPMSIGYGVAA
ncbi:class II glutamine amidotransferase [Devosia sp. 63-57]|uniref:class II glutamine amidotransferase n=1 Tax=Devosia sp. 63-57 TaxID=1895751 RepID=UPI00086B57A5|nr:class II glutamine amidotransferase [Devosia sp. 63-57]ODT47719.1 MAG: class II glutamine amidotransferase [Pelagibacterium sp. SCN 63-126]ODU88225.1 MAG: class II glutamine amidotransferase [Pelagibacterium sp. SCN 63-17]OJX42573.1 MAG: class II glutamine amidotransferase [Devosia sp. 63-57]